MAYVNASKLVIFVTSTQGNGEVPPASKRFFSSLLGKNRSLFSGKDCAVLGKILATYILLRYFLIFHSKTFLIFFITFAIEIGFGSSGKNDYFIRLDFAI